MREAHPPVLTKSMATLSQLPKTMGDAEAAEAGELVRGSMNCRIPRTGWAFGGCHLGVGSQGTPEEGSR